MDLKQIRYFVQIADAGSVSRAAELLHIAQPSLSLHLRNLEKDLNAELLVRHHRGVTLTDLGRQFYDQARSILNNVDYAAALIREQSCNPVGRIALGLPTSAARGISLRLMKAMSQRYPSISVRIVEAMTGDLDEWLQTGKLDVALLSNQKDFHNITWTEMMTEDLSVIARSDAPIAHRKCIEFEELPHHAIVLPSESHVIRIAVQACAARKGIKFDVAAECDSLMGIIQLVRGGYFTIGPRFAMAEEIERCELVAIPLVRPTPKWILSVATSKRTINSRASQAIAAVLADEIRSMVQAGSWPARLRKQAGERVVSV